MAKSKLRRREALAFYTFTSPWILGFLIFTIGPIIASLVLSFTNWDMFQAPTWIGLQNYQNLVVNTPLFWIALQNTAYYAFITVPLGIVIALILAVLLNQPLKLRRWFRAAFYLPSTLPTVSVVLLWSWLLAPQGLVNEALGIFGIKGPAWFVDPAWEKPGLILMALWGAGGGTVLFLAGLQGIPQYLYEAASLDGATVWNKLTHITIPMLSPIILFNLVTGIIGAMQVFTQVYIVGTNDSTLMMVPYLFQEAFQDFNMGFASAIAWVLFLIIIVFTLLILRWSSMWVYYEGEIRQ
ncbi:MAG: sugar ABC transporter permease [Firmicutes bacterium]|nr:sugar ABC transporter permease [Bacillota bacterium]